MKNILVAIALILSFLSFPMAASAADGCSPGYSKRAERMYGGADQGAAVCRINICRPMTTGAVRYGLVGNGTWFPAFTLLAIYQSKSGAAPANMCAADILSATWVTAKNLPAH